MEGKAEDILVIKKFRDRFPFIWLADEVGSYYSDTIGQLATQVRSSVMRSFWQVRTCRNSKRQ